MTSHSPRRFRPLALGCYPLDRWNLLLWNTDLARGLQPLEMRDRPFFKMVEPAGWSGRHSGGG